MVQYFFAALETLKAREDEGQGLVEYALILVLVSIAAIVIMGTLGTTITGVFQSVINALT